MPKCINCETQHDEDDINIYDRCQRCQGIWAAYVEVLEWLNSLPIDEVRKTIKANLPK